MALAYTAPTWQNGGGVGISASQLQALSDCMEGLVQGSDKAITNISISGQTITLTFADGSQETGTASGLKGISSIAKTGTSGLVDTYTITFTDGSTSTFTVTNGADGSFYIVTAGIKSTDDPYGNIEYYIGGDFYKNGVLYNQSAFYKVTLVNESDYPPTPYLVDGSSGTFTNGHYSTGSIGAIPSGATITTQIFTDSTMATLLGEVKVLIGLQGSEGEQGPQGPAGDDGVSPEVTITTITGGHRVNITDADHPSGQSFDVMDGQGTGDMQASVYDANDDVANAGGIANYVDDAIDDSIVANPTGTATGTLTKLGIGSDIYDIQGGGGDITFTLYSATQDTVTISQNGTTVKTVAIASGNSADVTLPKGRYTFTSSIAKNPDDLSAFYSKEVDITLVVIDVYLMPDNVLYWYGYQSSNLENLSTANGWVHQNTSYTFSTPVYNTNYITCTNGNNQVGGIATKNKISLKTAHGILEYKTGSSNGAAIAIDTSNKVVGASYYDIYTGASAAANVLEHISCSIQNTESKYALIETGANRSYQLYALWYDTESTDISDKADISAIGTNETGSTSSRAYAVGEHFYKNGKFCTAKAAIAQGASFTLGTNYVEGAVADCFTRWNYDEHFTGEYWIDGKPIYQKTVVFDSGPNNSEVRVDCGVYIDQVVFMNFIATYSNRTATDRFDLYRDGTWVGIYPNSTDSARRNKAGWHNPGDYSIFKGYLTFKYTKV